MILENEVGRWAECPLCTFDFAEGESEFVSGFNVEYGGGGFALIFVAEYASILFITLLFVLFFWVVLFIFSFLF